MLQLEVGKKYRVTFSNGAMDVVIVENLGEGWYKVLIGIHHFLNLNQAISVHPY